MTSTEDKNWGVEEHDVREIFIGLCCAQFVKAPWLMYYVTS